MFGNLTCLPVPPLPVRRAGCSTLLAKWRVADTGAKTPR